MSEHDARYLELFPSWLRTLGEDASALGAAMKDAPESVQRYIAAGLNYLFKSLDLIPDGIDDLGFLDDAFVLRVAASLALVDAPGSGDGVLGRLAADVEPLREFLGADYARLESYVKNLKNGAARGRTVDDILSDASVKEEFLREVKAWGEGFQVPSFARDPKTLIKLKAFLGAKLP